MYDLLKYLYFLPNYLQLLVVKAPLSVFKKLTNMFYTLTLISSASSALSVKKYIVNDAVGIKDRLLVHNYFAFRFLFIQFLTRVLSRVLFFIYSKDLMVSGHTFRPFLYAEIL